MSIHFNKIIHYTISIVIITSEALIVYNLTSYQLFVFFFSWSVFLESFQIQVSILIEFILAPYFEMHSFSVSKLMSKLSRRMVA